ncbi:MAG: hypothetical protein ACXVCK_00975 [Bdellovibrionota bacterium]
MKHSTLPALILFLSLSGCGKFLDQFSRLPGGFTHVVFNRDGQTARDLRLGFTSPELIASNVLNGGALIYAHNIDSGLNYSGTVGDETQTLSMIVPNGNYQFLAVGWPTANLTDTTGTALVRCGTGGQLALNGSTQDITLHLFDTTACYNDPNTAPSSTKEISPHQTLGMLNLAFCNSATTLSSQSVGGVCSGVDSSSNFYAGDPSYAKIDRVTYFSGLDTFMFAASHNSFQSTNSVPPTAPYELFRFNRSTGKQTKIPLATTGWGVTNPDKPSGKNRLVFLLKDASGNGALWSYNLSTGVSEQVSPTPVGGSAGVQEFQISDDGNTIVYAGDMDSVGLNELYSVNIPADSSDTFGTIHKISGSLMGTGVGKCSGSCGGEHQYFYEISPGTTNAYVAFAGLDATSGLNTVHFATLNGTNVPPGTVNGTSTTPTQSAIEISGSEISGSDVADVIDFSPDGAQIIYHVQKSTPADDAVTAKVSYVPGTSLNVSVPVVLTTSLTAPFFLTGNSTSKAILFLGSSPDGNNATTTVAVTDMSAGTPSIIKLFDETTGVSFLAMDYQLTPDDSTFVAAFGDWNATTPGPVRDVRSVPTTAASDYNGGAAGFANSFSYTGGPLVSPQQVKTLSSGNYGDAFRLSPVSPHDIIFISDKTVSGVYQLEQAALGSAATDIGGPAVTASAPVASATFDSSGTIYFTGALNSVGTVELYEANLAAGHVPTRLGSSGLIANINELARTDDMSISGIVPMEGYPVGATGIKETFLYSASTGSFSHIGNIWPKGATTPDPSGIGRVRISMLKSADGISFGPAFDSGCLSFTGNTSFDAASDLATSVRIPMGPGSGPSPYATRVEVFPLASDCSGSAQVYDFPNGIGAALNSTGGKAMLKASSGNMTLFLQDQ